MLLVDILYNGISVQAHFNKQINFLIHNSGTGKTLLMQAIILYCKRNSISFKHIDYNNADITASELVNLCKNSDVILLDNADFYLTYDILKELSNTAKHIIISMKNLYSINMIESDEFFVDYNNLNLSIKRF